MPVNRAFADAVLAELEPQPDARLLPRLPPVPRAALRARGAARRAARPLRAHPVAGARLLARAPRADPARDPRRPARERRRRLPRASLAPQLPALEPRPPRRGLRLRRGHASSYDGRGRLVAARPISVDPAEFDELAASAPVLALEERLVERGPEFGAARRPHRSVEERRPRLPRVRALPRRASRSCTAASGCSRCSTRRGRTSPSTPSTSARSSARRGASTTGSSRTAGRRSTSGSRTTSSSSVAAYKQYDVLLVNAIFDGLNLVAKEAPLVNERDGVLVLSENAGAHEELGQWALTGQPVRRRRPGRGDPPGARRCRRTSGARGSRRSARTCASTTSPAGSTRSSPISTGARVRREHEPRSSPTSTRRRASAWSTSAASRLSRRRARAGGGADGPPQRRLLRELPKGDALATAQLAGIMAAKRTSELIPLCHPLPLTLVDVELDVETTAWRSRPPPRPSRRPASRWRRSRRVGRRADRLRHGEGGRPSGHARSGEGRLVEKTKEGVKAAGADRLRRRRAGARGPSGDLLEELLSRRLRGRAARRRRRARGDRRPRSRRSPMTAQLVLTTGGPGWGRATSRRRPR